MSTSTQVTKTVVTRNPTDIEPKLIAVAIVAVLADVALVALFLAGAIDAQTLVAGLGPSALGIIAGYVKKSTHGQIDPAEVLDVAREVAGAVAYVKPDAAAAVVAVQDSIATLQDQLDASEADEVSATVSRATVSTDTTSR